MKLSLKVILPQMKMHPIIKTQRGKSLMYQPQTYVLRVYGKHWFFDSESNNKYCYFLKLKYTELVYLFIWQASYFFILWGSNLSLKKNLKRQNKKQKVGTLLSLQLPSLVNF